MKQQQQHSGGQGRVSYITFCILRPHYVLGRNEVKHFKFCTQIEYVLYFPSAQTSATKLGVM